jgi:GxxExxY protein
MELVHGELTRSVIGGFYEVYNELRYGLLENLYRSALVLELRDRGHHVEREVHVGVTYKGRPIGTQRLDLVVDGKLIVEVKSTHDLSPSAHRQLASYIRGSEIELGLLLHFGPEAKFYRQICTRRPGVSLGEGLEGE